MNTENNNQVKFFCARAGFKKNQKDLDLAIIQFPHQSNTVAIFTQNRFVAAPVLVARKNLKKSNTTRALLINSGNANCGNGAEGLETCQQSCHHLSEILGCDETQILPFSTGVINEPMSGIKLKEGINNACNSEEKTLSDAAAAILTTDQKIKTSTREFVIDQQTITLKGIAKGAGMICPNMATMLAFIWTNLTIEPQHLQQALDTAAEQSFHCITIDGDTSTNDSCTLTATGTNQHTLTPDSPHWSLWQSHLNQLCTELAKEIVLDGEGAHKFITITVRGGHNKKECKTVAYTVAHSPLVKTAFFAEDANLGRIGAAIGRAPIDDLNFESVRLFVGGYLVMKNAQIAENYNESTITELMKKKEIDILIDLARGNDSTTVWTTDLSHDYIRINSEYRT